MRTSKYQSAVSICQFLFPGMLLYVITAGAAFAAAGSGCKIAVAAVP